MNGMVLKFWAALTFKLPHPLCNFVIEKKRQTSGIDTSESDKTQGNSQEVRHFPASDHKATRNREGGIIKTNLKHK